jgi:glucokinase
MWPSDLNALAEVGDKCFSPGWGRSLDSDGAVVENILGIDVGGTKIAAGLVDPDGKVLHSLRRETAIENPEATLDSIAAAARDVISASGIDPKGIDAIGFGIPGLVDAEKGIGIASVNLGWRDVPVRMGLEARLRIRCAVDNDVRAGALGEARFGAARGLREWVYVNIGTGISAVILLQGRFLMGARGLAGEIGHAVLVPEGPECKCGGRGCFEAVASGPGIAERALTKIKSGRASMLVPADPAFPASALTAEAVFGAAERGDVVAVETLEEVGKLVAYALEHIALAYDPEKIVIGGSIMLGSTLLFGTVLEQLRELSQQSWVFGRTYSDGLVVLSALGNNAGVLGAAALVAPGA